MQFLFACMTIFSLTIFTSVEAQANVCDDQTKSFITQYDEYRDASKLALKRQGLLEDIRKWQNWRRNGELSEALFKRAKMENSIRFGLQFDDAYLVKNKLEAMSNRVQLAYHIVKKNRAMLEEITFWLEKNTAHADRPKMLKQLEELKAENLKHAKIIARDIDEYSAAFTTLNELAIGTDMVALHAKNVIDKLQSHYILDMFFKAAKITEKETPTVLQLYKVLEEYSAAGIYKLRLEKRAEMISTIVSMVPSPAEFILNHADKLMSRFPKLTVNLIRDFVSDIRALGIKRSYLRDIQTVLISEAEGLDQLKLLMLQNAGTKNDEFLQAFSKCIECKDKWNTIKRMAAESDADFFQRMGQAEEKAKNLGEYSLLRDEYKVKLLKRALDFALVSAPIIGLSYFYYDNGIAKTVEESEMAKPLSNEEENQLDELYDATAVVVEEMQKGNSTKP